MCRFTPMFLAVSATLAGCWPRQDSQLLPGGPLDSALVSRQITVAPPSIETARRVHTVGQKIMAANPDLALKPQFRTIGAPKPELFHAGASDLVITEGLVKLCVDDAKLAALLCSELGKMASEQKARSGLKTRSPDEQPPMDVRVGNDVGSFGGPADQTALAERAKMDRIRQRQAIPLPPPDPQVLARQYLTQAGYRPEDLEAVAPLLRQAHANSAFEKQLTRNP